MSRWDSFLPVVAVVALVGRYNDTLLLDVPLQPNLGVVVEGGVNPKRLVTPGESGESDEE